MFALQYSLYLFSTWVKGYHGRGGHKAKLTDHQLEKTAEIGSKAHVYFVVHTYLKLTLHCLLAVFNVKALRLLHRLNSLALDSTKQLLVRRNIMNKTDDLSGGPDLISLVLVFNINARLNLHQSLCRRSKRPVGLAFR